LKLDDLDKTRSFAPQLFCRGEPTNEWGLEELGVYATLQHRQILDGEKLLTPAYWRLGHALALAKDAFKHGKWAQYLKDLGIDKTRAAKARAIYRSFGSPDEVAKLTVEEAYAERERRQPARADDDGADVAPASEREVRQLRKSVKSIAEQTESVVDAAAFAPPEEARILIPVIQNAIQHLQELVTYLEQQAATTGVVSVASVKRLRP